MIEPIDGGDRASGVEVAQDQPATALGAAAGDAHRLLWAAIEHIGGEENAIEGLLPEIDAPHLGIGGIGLTAKHAQAVRPLEARLLDQHHQIVRRGGAVVRRVLVHSLGRLGLGWLGLLLLGWGADALGLGWGTLLPSSPRRRSEAQNHSQRQSHSHPRQRPTGGVPAAAMGPKTI